MSTRPHTNRTTILQVGIAAALLFAVTVLISAAFAEGVGGAAEFGAGTAPAGDSATDGTQDRVTVLGRMDGRVSESSGVAVSTTHPGVLWTHNDGSEGSLHAISLDGELRASFTVTGAEAVDWEDIARAPCPGGGSSGDCLFIADTGDNDATRERVRILVVREPERLDEGGAIAPLTVAVFRYADGPTDAEALAIAEDGRALIVSKGNGGETRLYELASDAFTASAGSGSQAMPIATLPIDSSSAENRVTGAALSPDGRTLAVRTRRAVYLFDVDEWERAPRVCRVAGSQPQGEAVAWRDAGTLVLTSEGAESPILSVRCP